MSGTTAKSKEQQRDFAEKFGTTMSTPSTSATPASSGSGSIADVNDEKSHLEAAHARETNTEKVPLESTRNDQSSDSPQSEDPERPSIANFLSNRDISFADQPTPSSQTHEGNTGTNMSRHVRILQRQQSDAKKGGALRIPGPRDFDAGDVPEVLQDNDEPIYKVHTRHSAPAQSENLHPVDSQPENPHVRRGITINEPERPTHRDRTSEDNPAPSGFSILERLKSNVVRRKPSGRSLGIGQVHSMARTFNSMTSARTRDRVEDPSPYLSWQATTGRNSAFLGLTEHQREELGGIEYRSLKTLAVVLLIYYLGFHLMGIIVLAPWIVSTQPWKDLVISDGVGAAWWGIFTPASMFNDLGFTLTPDSMNSFEYAVVPLLFGSFLIVIGNTGFPIMLRFMIWVGSKIVPFGSGVWEELEFLLDHPRRCFTLLFPSKATWWLFWILVLLNGIDLLFFVVLDLDNTPVSSLEGGYKVLNGWFQAVSTRTAGFSCVNLAALHPAVQVSYLIMMYISVFPIAISVRRTNVYEEKSLGIFGGEEEVNEDGEPSYVGQHLRRQLSFDLWYIFLGLFIIAWAEGDRIQDNNQPGFTMFSILFEIVSAYGTVGLSLGYPGINASFSAEFGVISKLVIIAMMIRGRHRGLPYALDRAILLPSEKLQAKEAELADARHGVDRRRSSTFHEAHQTGYDMDEYGLPLQHLTARTHGVDHATFASGDTDADNHTRPPVRRMSAMSTASRSSQRTRRKSLATFLASGLSAGPTVSKRD
jgi:potassium uptake Trk family protein